MQQREDKLATQNQSMTDIHSYSQTQLKTEHSYFILYKAQFTYLGVPEQALGVCDSNKQLIPLGCDKPLTFMHITIQYLPELFKSLRTVVQTSTNGTGELCIFIHISKLQPFDQFISNGALNCMTIMKLQNSHCQVYARSLVLRPSYVFQRNFSRETLKDMGRPGYEAICTY